MRSTRPWKDYALRLDLFFERLHKENPAWCYFLRDMKNHPEFFQGLFTSEIYTSMTGKISGLDTVWRYQRVITKSNPSPSDIGTARIILAVGVKELFEFKVITELEMDRLIQMINSQDYGDTLMANEIINVKRDQVMVQIGKFKNKILRKHERKK